MAQKNRTFKHKDGRVVAVKPHEQARLRILERSAKWTEVEGDVETETQTINATDSALELANEHGVDLTQVVGTGADGRVLKSDVQAAIDG